MTTHTPDTGHTPDTSRSSLVDAYLAAYAEPDEARRRELVARCFTADATLADPPFTAVGHQQLLDTFGAVVQQFPGHRFRRTSGIDEHHDTARYAWVLEGPDGTAAVAGMDVVRFDGSSRIAAVTGFFGDLPDHE
jgi:hypothetical protein